MSKIFKKYGIMLGSDPEILLKKSSNGHTNMFPVTGLIGGSKDAPLMIDKTGFRGLQEDNVAIEYTTHPTTLVEDFIEEQQHMFNVARKAAVKAGLLLHQDTSAQYSPQLLKHDAVQAFGCDPTWNAWTNKENPQPDVETTMRSAGGHIHVSYNKNTDAKSLELVRLCDLIYLSITKFSGSIDFRNNHEIDRRRLYGKSGEMRIKSYGFEWRTPSNDWIFEATKMAEMHRIVETAFKVYHEGKRVKKSSYNIIQQAINGETTAIIKLFPNITKNK